MKKLIVALALLLTLCLALGIACADGLDDAALTEVLKTFETTCEGYLNK